MDTHGLLTRAKFPALLALPPAQREKNGALLSDQELPPSKEAATPIACEPPVDQRFCCHTAMRLELLKGLTASCGSSAVPLNSVPSALTPSQLGASVLGCETLSSGTEVQAGGPL